MMGKTPSKNKSNEKLNMDQTKSKNIYHIIQTWKIILNMECKL